MQREDRGRDDEAWRAIVDNYGDRVELDDEPPAATPPTPDSADLSDLPPEPPQPVLPTAWQDARTDPRTDPRDDVAAGGDPDRFVPPDPPLPPRPTRDRLAAWAGLIGSPLVLLVMVLAGLDIPGLLAWAMVAGFVGGFLYLVLHLPRSPEDPWDDGARL